MDFYSAQDHARRQTKRLVVLFGGAVLALIVLTNLVILTGLWAIDERLFASWLYVVEAPAMDGASPPLGPIAYLNWRPFALVSAVVCTGVGLATLWKTVQLSRGGMAIARMLGGEPLTPSSAEPAERRLLNVVEEMALAASLPVPPVYVLPESAINAFAAGFAVDDAIIGVTRGALQQLNREELQGVIGHEFSHILNGDMRLNMRLLALLNGILFIANTGRIILRVSSDGSSFRGGSRRGAGGSFALLGLGLMVVGFAGVFFGRMIKAGVSRQREFLADASAVQFTRNPLGLAGALQRIGGIPQQGRLEAPRAEEASHLFFAHGIKQDLAGLFATHPPLDKRIRRLDPTWNGHFVEPRTAAPEDELTVAFSSPAGADDLASRDGSLAACGVTAPLVLPVSDQLRSACRDGSSAQALVLACVQRAGGALQRSTNEQIDFDARQIALLNSLGDGETLQLLELAMPALKRLPGAALGHLRRQVDALVEEDQRLGLGEMVIVSLLTRHLWSDVRNGRASAPRFKQLQQVESALCLLFSALAWAIHVNETDAIAALQRAGNSMQLTGLRLLARDSIRWVVVDGAMTRLRGLFPLQKPRVLKACRAMLNEAGGDSAYATQVLHTLAAAIDCPVE